MSNSSNEKDIEQKIVEELLNTEKNLDTKTELNYPIKWASLNLLQNYLELKGMENSSNVLKHFLNIAFKYLISNNRKGRLEYIQALQSVRENQKEKMNESNPLSMEIKK